MTKANWYKHVNWLNVTLIVGIPIYGLIQAWWVPLRWQTAVWAVAYYFMTGLGITAGKFFVSADPMGRRLTLIQVTIDYGHIPPTQPHFPYESSLLLLAVEPLKDP